MSRAAFAMLFALAIIAGATAAETKESDATTTEAPKSDATTTAAPKSDATTTEAPKSDATTTAAPNRGDVSTSMTTAVGPGDSVLDVASTADFLVGDEIVIDKGLPSEETHTIKAISSITTSSPMQKKHKAGASVQLKPTPTTAAPTTAAPTTAAPTTAAPTTAAPTTAAPVTAAPVTAAPVALGSPCDVVTTPAALGSPCDVVIATVTTTPGLNLAGPCATNAVAVRLFQGKDAKHDEAQAFTLNNAGLLVMGFACVAALTVGVRSMKRRSSTRAITRVDLEEGEALKVEYDEQQQQQQQQQQPLVE